MSQKKGYKHSETARAKIAAGHRGLRHSEETRAKIGAGHLKGALHRVKVAYTVAPETPGRLKRIAHARMLSQGRTIDALVEEETDRIEQNAIPSASVARPL